MRTSRQLLRIVDEFASARVTVIGDAMLDRAWLGTMRRRSLSGTAGASDLGVPIVDVQEQTEAPGGAANVAANLTALGAQCRFIGVVGDDEAGRRLRGLLQAHAVQSHLIIAERPTTTKLYVRAAETAIARCDFESTAEVTGATAHQLEAKIDAAVSESDAVVISDYAKGVCTQAVCRRVIERARAARADLPIVVDPKHADWRRFADASVIVPNLRECSLASGDIVADDDDIITARMRPFLDRLRLAALMVTRDVSGLTLIRADGVDHFAATSIALDPTGAGDTVAAVLALALAHGSDLTSAAQLANLAAGCVVEHLGTRVVSGSELSTRVHEHRAELAPEPYDVNPSPSRATIFGQG